MVFPQLRKTLSIKRWPASFDQYVKPFPEAILMLRVWLTLASLPKCDCVGDFTASLLTFVEVRAEQ